MTTDTKIKRLSHDDFIFADTNFGTISEMGSTYIRAIDEFIENYINKHPNRDMLICELSNLYVLMALKCSEVYLKEGERNWGHILTSRQNDLQHMNCKILR